MEALITLYTRLIGIEAEKLQMIEDIENYLASKEPNASTFTCQYQKPTLNLTIKVALNESYSSPLQANNYCYVKLTNKDNLTKHFYYFIKKLTWKSQDCIELDLVMDTLNSFKLGTDYTFSPKTIIQRQHKDRMEFKETTTYSTEEYEVAQYDDITPNTYFMMNKTHFTSGHFYQFFGNGIIFDDDYAYYYVYNTTTNKLIKWSEYQWGGHSDVKFNKIMSFFDPNDQDEHSYLMLDDVLVAQDIDPEDLPANIIPVILTHNNGDINNDQADTLDFWGMVNGKVNVDHQEFGLRNVDLLNEELEPILYADTSSKQKINDDFKSGISWYLLIRKTGDSGYPFGFYFIPSERLPYKAKISTGYDEGYLTPINSINTQADSIVKIIKLPYLPVIMFLQDGKIYVDNTDTIYGLRYFSNLLQPSPVQPTGNFIGYEITPQDYASTRGFYSTSLMRVLYDFNYASFIRVMRNDLSGQSLIQNRNDDNESKMYHSEFYSPKIVYDSFAFPYQMELLDMEQYNLADLRDMKLSFKFVCSRTANSTFAFEFTDYRVKFQLIDYPNWLIIRRNNEELVVNDAYISYLQNGYNYDLKAKQQSNITNWASFGLSAIATIGAGLLTYATGGASAPLLLATFAGGISTAKNLTNAISSTITNERNMEKKIEELKRQSANISGSDDVSIMNEYCDNKAFKIIYKVSSRMDKLLKDLFYYYGYKDNITGTPNLTTRIWFNYLKCEPVLEFSSINMTQEIEDELKAIMRSGFTLYHKYNGTWDIEQVKENWEVSMVSHLN